MNTPTIKQSSRLLSLDVLRGITICGMILVNNAGACGYPYEMLRHAKWDGFTPADLVFPMFLFLMGVSIFLSLSKQNFDKKQYIPKILRRTALLILIGIALKWVINSSESGNWIDFEHMRIMGVLQRLGICYGIVAMLSLYIDHRHFLKIALSILGLYYLMQLIGYGFEKSSRNIISIIDYAILTPKHMYLQGKQFVDPEGILSTLTSAAQVMIGFYCGRMLKRSDSKESLIRQFFILGTIMLFVGYMFSFIDPLNKRLWSPSFVLLTSGISTTLLALSIYWIDMKGKKKGTFFFQVFGVNPLFLYILSYILGDWLRLLKWNEFTFDHFFQPLFGNHLGSFMYAFAFVLLNWLIGYILFKKKIYIKL